MKNNIKDSERRDIPKRLYVTIDTEMDADIHWKKMWPPEYSSVIEGIPKLFRPIWDKYDVHPIYFLSPEILYSEECIEVLKNEMKNGAVIGAHLHPEYIEPESKIQEGRQIARSEFPCSDYDYSIEKLKIENLTKLIAEKLGAKPEWYRAARFGADEDTYKILDELGYRNESSVTPGIDWSDRGGVNYDSFEIGSYPIINTNIVEHPVTICSKRWGLLGRFLPNNWLFFRWLRPTHMTYIEMRRMVAELSKRDLDELVMMFHSMEPMICKTPYVRYKWMQKYYIWRVDKILNYAKRCGYEL